MGSGHFVGGFDGWLGAALSPLAEDPLQPGAQMAGGFDGWLGPVLGVPVGGGGCPEIGLHDDGTFGSYTLSGTSVDPIILGELPYDFSCSANANINLSGTVDSRIVTIPIGQPPGFPEYGIFVVSVVPPAGELFTVILPDVDIATIQPTDTSFHTFTGSRTIVNPGAARTVIFAVRGHTHHTGDQFPVNYQYKNFNFDVT